MSTRTSVRFGSILANLIRDRMSYFEEAFTEVTSQYILYGYRKPISTAYNGFILIQASRTKGQFAMEVGVTRGDTFPYHRLNDHPDIGLVGYREAVFTLLKNYNHSEEYQNAESLFRILYSLLKDAEMAMSRLMERVSGKIQGNYDRWQQLYSKWLELELEASGPPGKRYPSVNAESLAFEIIEDILTSGVFDRYLGPLKYRYRNPQFMNCHVYLLARGLEFLEPPEPPINQISTDPPPGKKLAPALDDPISGLTGRLPQSYSVELSSATRSKTTQYAFLKSLSAVEALLKLDEAGNPVRTDGFQFFNEVSQQLIEAPDYIKPSYPSPPSAHESLYSTMTPTAPTPAYQPPAAEVAPPPPAKVPQEGVLNHRIEPKKPKQPVFSFDDADDPIAMLESRFGMREI